MRWIGLVLCVLGLNVGDLHAKWPRVKLLKDSVRVGIPPGRSAGERDDTGAAAHVFKSNQWAPIYFDLEVTDLFEKPEESNIYLFVEALDGDGYGTRYRLPLGNLAGRSPGEQIKSIEFRWTPYCRLSTFPFDLKLTVEDERQRPLSESITLSNNLRPEDASKYVVMSLGSKLASFDIPAAPGNANQPGQNNNRTSRVTTASILEWQLMPDQWIGYDCVDMCIIGTAGTKDFIPTLFGENGDRNPAIRARRDALLEWVRRGGRLVISVGTNAALCAQYKTLQDLLPLPINPAEPKADYPTLKLVGPPATTGRDGVLKPKDGTIPVAGFRKLPERAVRTVMTATYLDNPVGQTVPLIVQSPFGLGRITVVGFDLDRSPFVDYSDRSSVWSWLLKECGSPKAVAGVTTGGNQNNQFNNFGLVSEDDYSAALQRDLDRFEGVPVISFGWVALFVLLYTLVIGPLEYIILKKVFKRLELTWITFPIIVLTVSVVSYYSAYALKGSDLKLNKFDVIDVDSSGGRVYGRTWVSLFSPRQESFTIGVSPNTDWIPERPQSETPPTLVDWVHGRSGARGNSLFRSNYSYHLDLDPNAPKFADGLIDVMVKVWSVKSVTANWSAEIDPAKPIVESKLIHPPADPTTVAGSFTVNLPFGRMSDVRMIYGDKVYKLADIESGQNVNVLLEDSKLDSQWFVNASNLQGLSSVLAGVDEFNGRWNRNANIGPTEPGSLSFWGAMFHEKAIANGQPLNNATIRKLDQSWRAEKWNTNEVMIVGRLPVEKGLADDVLGKPQSISPTRLWLKDLPKPGKSPPKIDGKIRQETYVRLFVPIKPNVK